ncbi:hypothetical protein GOBAR_AA24597 [Gossypium barbadense]|uniref:DUF7804 domain-containing protein n=1 Tax=Gossypium barbadense TaxID=3634 RepID=A0A2P5WY95_GOSBA|nr:hypothetical protein GOBAR_AA24597 [Gossypium barbadense]
MAAADGVCRGGNVCLRRRDSFNLFNFHNQNARPRCFMVSGSQSSSGSRKEKMLASSKVRVSLLQPLLKQEKTRGKEFSYEKIDEWMRDSVAEIVKRLPESPLLVEVFSDVKNNTTRTRTEKAEEDKWGLLCCYYHCETIHSTTQPEQYLLPPQPWFMHLNLRVSGKLLSHSSRIVGCCSRRSLKTMKHEHI